MARFLTALLLFIGLPLLPAHADNPCAGGIGGTGDAAQRGGGVSTTAAAAPQGGIGGTGKTADSSGIGGTGIVGIITGFGSICVNGIEIHYDANTPTQTHGKPTPVGRLAIGQVVAVEAVGVGAQVRAQRIEVVPAVVGPIEAVDLGRGTLRVLGQNVRITAETAMVRRDLKVGESMQVSGLREPRGAIIASRIEPAAAGIAVVSGPVGRIDTRGFQMHGLAIETAAVAGLEPGRVARVTGVWDGNRLRAERVEVEPSLPFDGRVRALSLQGYVGARAHGERIRVGNTEVQVNAGTRIVGATAADLAHRRVHVQARLDASRRLVADRIEVERTPIERRESHRGASDKHRDGTDNERHTEHRHDEAKGERGERAVESERPEHARPEHKERTERPERSEQSERAERPERPERIEREERPERPERPEHNN